MKKIILLLLIAQLTNISGAAKHEFQEICKIHNKFEAILIKQDFNQIESFIIKNINSINTPGEYNQTMLIIVGFLVQQNRIKDDFAFIVVKFLIQIGSNILHKYSDNYTIFHDMPDLVIKAVEEIEKEGEELTQKLLTETQIPEEIIDIIRRYHSENQPQLMNNPILTLKACAHADTPLHTLARFHYNRPEGIKLLVKYKADLQAQNALKLTPLFYAMHNPEKLKLMIDLGPVNKQQDIKKVEKTSAQCCVIQ